VGAKHFSASQDKAKESAASKSFLHCSGDKIPGALAGTRILSMAFKGSLPAYDRLTAKEKSAETLYGSY
jgi:hypothetical protein